MKQLKSYFTTVILVIISTMVLGQDVEPNIKLEKSIYNAHIGLFFISISNESRLIGQMSLKSELIFFPHFNSFGILPALSLEPRYYYSRKRRAVRNKDIRNNAGSYFALKTTYFQGDWLFNKDMTSPEGVVFTPLYGYKMNFTSQSKFSCESMVGINLQLPDSEEIIKNKLYYTITISYQL